ncbi:sensor histidine kinase [Larkinella soli]|uniref:sensor histidine kinase n=1 Tax=Larkinella soli TaxID=1770527 RepID=UPI000FFB7C7D|nr:sensor histidine kinase [Larkinella soli]
MKFPSYSRYDSLLQAIVLPLYIGGLNWLLVGNDYWMDYRVFGIATGVLLGISFLNWYVNNIIALKINEMYPDPREYLIRAIRRFIACTISSCLHVLSLYFIYQQVVPAFDPDPGRLSLALLFTTVIVVIVVATYESIDSFDYWQQSRRQVDTLIKAQLEAELAALRQQVNPHFLFNSLNTLISLIGENPRQAEEFAEELSSVYRYLLRNNVDSLTPLSNELEFIQSYFHLLKTRHGDALSLVTEIHPGTETAQLPPLTLQLLIENAVKHNIILPDQPLTIILTTDENRHLIVRNNLQRKPSRALSNGVGLSNILSKYRMLGQPVPTIEDDGREFRVRLPLV